MKQTLLHTGRREFLEASAATVVAVTCGLFTGCNGRLAKHAPATVVGSSPNLYFDLLKTWCDGLLAHQINEPAKPERHGAFRCPACETLHGRCADAAYPLLHMAEATGDRKYVEAALRVQDWAEANVTQSDGSWVVGTEGTWRGITVFGAVALAESLLHYSHLLDEATCKKWSVRLDRAMVFLDGFFTMSTSNINYPSTCSLAFTLAGEVLGNAHYRERGREFAHASICYLTANGMLFGEGKPPTGVSPKKCRPIDLGYNVEESLPSLTLYAHATGDQQVRDAMVNAWRAHLEFMLPDGGWDNSWGTRQAKWTWWGSRTCDGCQPGLVLLAEHDPRFLEAALRNTQRMSACTHDGLLHGGPHYRLHGEPPCVHHTFTHAKALATVLNRGGKKLLPARRLALPREEAKGLKHFPESGTYLAAAGQWRATFTESDVAYPNAPGGHPSGGALSLLYHLKLGPILVASMTAYNRVEALNMQLPRDSQMQCLTPRLEYVEGDEKEKTVYTNLSDYTATLTAETHADGGLTFTACGRLVSVEQRDPANGAIRYSLMHRVSAEKIQMLVNVEGSLARSVTFILPVICTREEAVGSIGKWGIRIVKPGGTLELRTDAPGGWEQIPARRVFNLVPGFECLPLFVTMPAGGKASIEIIATT